MWSALQTKTAREVRPGHTVIATSDVAIDSFEGVFCKLPRSYKKFLKSFGPGTFNYFFNIYAPLKGHRVRHLAGETRRVRASSALAEAYHNDDLLQRAVPFADTIVGDIFVWDPDDVVDEQQNEYRIFVLPRHSADIRAIADTFTSFIFEVCFGHRYEEVVIKAKDPAWEINYVFQPLCKRARR